MKNRTFSISANAAEQYEVLTGLNNRSFTVMTPGKSFQKSRQEHIPELAEILFITSYPPRECGIATYSQDLIKALNNQFSKSLSIKVCALESGETNYSYPDEVKYILKTSQDK